VSGNFPASASKEIYST